MTPIKGGNFSFVDIESSVLHRLSIPHSRDNVISKFAVEQNDRTHPEKVERRKFSIQLNFPPPGSYIDSRARNEPLFRFADSIQHDRYPVISDSENERAFTTANENVYFACRDYRRIASSTIQSPRRGDRFHRLIETQRRSCSTFKRK